ncbi:MAG: 5-deoxy-glucuronate isomerase [Candidatus Sumerlaeota bacterium]|nr:5-deoxy-glucuronate isomerase [Candidatus Sumerlaeota bacterium]
MSPLQTKRIAAPGLHRICKPRSGGLEYLSFALMNLEAGGSLTWETKGMESALVLLEGEVEMSGAGLTFTASRKNVFEENPWTLYLPPGAKATVKAFSKAQVAVCSSRASQTQKAFAVPPNEVKVEMRGKGNFLRKVCDIIDPSRDVNHLLLGETFNGPGNWSSYPPHRHDVQNPPEEVNLEEIYFFKTQPEQGFGLMRIYTDDRRLDQPLVIENDDTVEIAEGYHPVVAAGGYQLYYLWMLAGPGRQLIPRDDPAHAWVKKL